MKNWYWVSGYEGLGFEGLGLIGIRLAGVGNLVVLGLGLGLGFGAGSSRRAEGLGSVAVGPWGRVGGYLGLFFRLTGAKKQRLNR